MATTVNPLSLYDGGRNTLATLALSGLLGLWYILVYFLQAPSSYAVVIAVLFSAHSVGLWLYTVYAVMNPRRRWRPSIMRAMTIGLIAILQYTFLYSALMLVEPDAFTGIGAGRSRTAKFFLSMFISTETMTALGSGTIFARDGAGAGPYVLIALNSIHGMVFWSLIIGKIVESTRRRSAQTRRDTSSTLYATRRVQQ